MIIKPKNQIIMNKEIDLSQKDFKNQGDKGKKYSFIDIFYLYGLLVNQFLFTKYTYFHHLIIIKKNIL